jgi:predicted dehydrogenase
MIRVAIVGTGARADTFFRGITGEYADRLVLAALVDPNMSRMALYNARLKQRVPAYAPDQFPALLDTANVDLVIVTSVDRTHDHYIVGALEAGRDVITEKPMTIDAPRCRRIMDAVRATGRSLRVAFNYRYNVIHERVHALLGAGEIGQVNSVHFEWLLDVHHGADYFRRWHRDKANSGGLLVHKATHHFDLVSWWLRTRPEGVFAVGGRVFYGAENGLGHGYARPYRRAHGAPEADSDPFALKLADDPWLKALYLDAEHEDGYHRDANVFGEGITIDDDMAVLVRYASGATMTYHLNAYAPWEGYRISFNGSAGRLELEVVEADPGGEPHARILIRPLWEPMREVSMAYDPGGHGGADDRMLASLFGGQDKADFRAADAVDGAMSVLTGVAANQSSATGRPVRVTELL